MNKKMWILIITKNLIFICLSFVILISFTACSSKNKNLRNNNTSTSIYPPVVELWKGTSTPIQSIVDSIHSVGFQGGWVVAAVPNNDLIVSSPAQYNDPRYPDGLYILNTTSGKVTALFHVNADKHEQINNAAANQKWLVYELVTYGSPGKWSLYAYNLVTKKSYEIYSVPNSFIVPDGPSGLHVEGDQCIWSNYIESDTSNEIISEIHDYNLVAQKDDILLRSTTNQSSSSQVSNESNQYDYKNGIIFSTSVGGGKVIFSLHDGVNPIDTSPAGDIYEIDLGTKQISHLLHLYHAACPISSYGDQVVMDTNYNPVPNSAQNPVYLYTKGDKSIYQLSPGRDVYYPTQNERFIAWEGDLAEEPQVYDLKTGTYYTVPGISAMVSGGYVTWSNPKTGMLYWAQLPN